MLEKIRKLKDLIEMVAAWLKGKTNVLVGGMPALMSDSMAICACGGGIIKIQKDGQ